MAEEVKIEKKANLIKKGKVTTPVVQSAEIINSNNTASQLNKNKVIIKKKAPVTVRVKASGPSKDDVTPIQSPVIIKTDKPLDIGVKIKGPRQAGNLAKPVIEEKKDEEKTVTAKVIKKESIISGNHFLNNSETPQDNRIKTTLHTGPVIIKSSNLPPVPGQKTDSEKKTQGPRVAGIVGGRREQRPNSQVKNNAFGQRQQGQFSQNKNSQAGQSKFVPKAGSSYTPPERNNQSGQFRGNNNQHSQGFSPSSGRAGGFRMSPQAAVQPSPMELNQKGKGRNVGANKKKDYELKYQKDEELDFQFQKKKADSKLAAVPKSIDIMENITVADLAKKMNLKASDIIGKLFKMGLMVTINQQIDHDTAEIIASEYGCQVHLVSLYDETIIEQEEDKDEDLLPRAPIVTIMGHVDHGKTKLLDAIRSSDVVSGEFGGITQHIGAYKVNVSGKGDVVFLDTPGHAAFSMMRARGAQVTDIVVLVVAANDGVMPQTREAIDHAKAAKVPIIVAINKIDLPDANPERVMQQLSDLGLMPEAWGGQTLYTEISALKKMGIDDLLDTILLQAEMLELKANPNCRAVGKVLESRIDQGRGTVATIIIEKGTLKQGDYYVAGIYSGRVRAMFDDKGKKIKSAGPSDPVEIIGLSNIPSAGDPFQVTEDEKTARSIASKRQELEKLGEGNGKNKITLENLKDKIQEGQIIDFNVVIKGDVQGSVEALQGVLEKLSTPEIKLNVLRASAGAIIESDISLAAASDAVVIGFNVRPTPRAQALAEQEKVEIKKYNVIYDVVDDVRDAMEGKLSPEIKEVDIGKVEIRETFKVPKVGLIAGCMVLEGKVKRNSLVRVIRDSIQINSNLIKISSLKRFKDDAKEVNEGYECGIGLEGWQDLQIGDILEIVETEEVRRTLETSQV